MSSLSSLSSFPSETSRLERLALQGPAPDFEAMTTHGPLKLSEWQQGRWVVLFSHPADFTPVCTTEFVEFARCFEGLAAKNVALLGLSIDSIYSHIAWLRAIEDKFGIEIPFPIIADLDQKVARLYGMVHVPSAATATVRCVFIMDPKRILRAMVYYPLTVGRNFHEIVRLVDALQTVDAHGVACPANWRPGDDVVVPAPTTAQGAQARVQDTRLNVTDWYLSTRHLETPSA